MSQTTKQTPFEIVFGQRPNTLERFDVGNGEHVLDEENVEELLSGNDDECVALYVYMLNMSPPTSLPERSKQHITQSCITRF